METENERLPYKSAVLRNRKGDLSKTWYIEYYVWHAGKQSLVRCRHKLPLSIKDKKGRIDLANKKIAIIDRLLAKGYHYKSESEIEESNLDLQQDSIIEEKNDSPSDPRNLVTLLRYFLKISQGSLRSKSASTYQSAIQKLEVYGKDKNLTVDSFLTNDAIAFRDYLIVTLENSPRTCNNTIDHLKALFTRIVERKIVLENPFVVKGLKTLTSSKNIAFTDHDKWKVEQYMLRHEPELYLLTRFIYLAFIRPGELNNLKIGDIRLAQNYITIHGSISKNGQTETAQIISSLHEEIASKLSLKDAHFYIFGKGLKTAFEISGKQVAFRRHEAVLRALKLDKMGYTLYSWKHTGAVNAYKSGVGLKELQGLLRHSSIEVTDVYLKSLGLRTDPNINNYNW